MARTIVRFALVLLLLAGACSKRSEPPGPAPKREAVVAAPEGLVGELSIPEPRRLWAELRRLGGSRAEIFPSSFELALFAALDLPPRVAGYVRPETPVIGVALTRQATPPAWVLGVRTVRGSELVDELTRGPDAPLRAERDGSPVTVLVGSKPTPVLGVVDDWLLVSSERAALSGAGAYVARGLGRRPLPEVPLAIEVNRTALRGPLSASVRENWSALRASLSARDRQERAERGRAPDFGDPTAVLGIADGVIDALLELIASSERLRFGLSTAPEHVALSFSLVPEERGALARSLETLEVGGLEPLLALPRGVMLAALSRSSTKERDLAAEKPADALRALLGPRLAEKDAAPLAGALRNFHRGRGAVAVVGVFADSSLFLRQEAREPKELERGLRGLLRLLGVPALAGPLEPLIGKVTPRESELAVAGVDGPVHRVELVRPGPQSAGFEALLHVRGSGASVVAASKASAPLAALVASERDRLRDMPLVAKLAEGRAPGALSLYADLSPLGPAGGPAPALAVLGKQRNEALLELELSAPACAALLERFGSP